MKPIRDDSIVGNLSLSARHVVLLLLVIVFVQLINPINAFVLVVVIGFELSLSVTLFGKHLAFVSDNI